jgi:hypothetical protein
MGGALEALKRHAHDLLVAIETGETESLARSLDRREQLLQALGDALAGGEGIDPAEARAVLALDGELLNALTARRDAVWQEIAALRSGRSAASAYQHAIRGKPVYVDREG